MAFSDVVIGFLVVNLSRITKDLLKIDLQLRLPQRHCLQSRDDSIADQRPSIFSCFNYRLLMIIVYTKLRSQNCTIHVHGKSMLFLLYA